MNEPVAWWRAAVPRGQADGTLCWGYPYRRAAGTKS